MRERAPRALPMVAGILREHRLTFESNEPAGAADAFFANIRADAHSFVPGALYEIDADGLSALDAYEDLARGVYERSDVIIARADGVHASAIVYRMRTKGPERGGEPSLAQLAQIREGYADWGLDLRVLEAALGSISARMA